jgi:hypothetical protein
MQYCWTFAGDPGEQMKTLLASRRPLFASVPAEVKNAKEYPPRLSQPLARNGSGQQTAATSFFELRRGEILRRSEDPRRVGLGQSSERRRSG